MVLDNRDDELEKLLQSESGAVGGGYNPDKQQAVLDAILAKNAGSSGLEPLPASEPPPVLPTMPDGPEQEVDLAALGGPAAPEPKSQVLGMKGFSTEMYDKLAARQAEKEAALDEVRKRRGGADFLANLGQAASGSIANATGIKHDTGAYDALRKQSAQEEAGATSDVDRRSKEVTRFLDQKAKREDLNERINSRESMAKDSRDLKRELAKVSSDEKAKKAATPDRTQVDKITGFDSSINGMKDVVTLLGDKSGWTGPLDAMVPDFWVGGDEAAFRSAAGKIADAYQHLITGAGAGNKEIARLASRLPQVSDTPENFQAKAKEFIRVVQGARFDHLNNLNKQGKDVSPWLDSAETAETHRAKPPGSSNVPASETKVMNGKTYVKAPGGWKEQ